MSLTNCNICNKYCTTYTVGLLNLCQWCKNNMNYEKYQSRKKFPSFILEKISKSKKYKRIKDLVLPFIELPKVDMYTAVRMYYNHLYIKYHKSDIFSYNTTENKTLDSLLKYKALEISKDYIINIQCQSNFYPDKINRFVIKTSDYEFIKFYGLFPEIDKSPKQIINEKINYNFHPLFYKAVTKMQILKSITICEFLKVKHTLNRNWSRVIQLCKTIENYKTDIVKHNYDKYNI